MPGNYIFNPVNCISDIGVSLVVLHDFDDFTDITIGYVHGFVDIASKSTDIYNPLAGLKQ